MNQRLLAASALLVGLSACGPTRFVRTDSAHVEARASRLPAVFIDQAPDRPWRAVGKIEVRLSGRVSADELAAVAAEAGQQAGCELLVRGARARQSSSRQFTIQLAVLPNGHDHGDHAPPPPPREQPEQKDSASSSTSSSEGSGDKGSGGQEAPASGGGDPVRTRRWTFDCGVYEAPAAGATST